MKKHLFYTIAALFLSYSAAFSQGAARKTDTWIYNTNPNVSLPTNRNNIPTWTNIFDTTNGNWYTKTSNSVYKLHQWAGTGGGGTDTTIIFASSDSSSPEAWGAVHAATTFAAAGLNQAYIDLHYPGAGAVTTDMIDWAACQASYNWSKDNGWWHGSGMYYVNKGILFDNVKRTNMINFLFTATNSTAFTFISRTFPANTTIANVQQNIRCTFKNIYFYGGTSTCTQSGINIQGCKGVIYENVGGASLARLITAEFQLEGLATGLHTNECTMGIAIGYLAGFDPTFYQSNNFTVTKSEFRGRPRVAGVSPSTSAVRLRSVDKCVVDQCTFEGYSFVKPIDFDDENITTVFMFTAQSLWFEPSEGIDSAAIKIRSRQGTMRISDPRCGTNNYLLDMYTYTGNSKVIIEGVALWETGGNPTIRNGSGACSGSCNYAGYVFHENNQSYFNSPSNILNLYFNNAPSQVALGTGCNSNCFTFQ